MNTTSKAHSYFDYVFSLFLMLSPWLLGFGEAKAETLTPVLVGMAVMFYSFFTDYSGGMYRRIAYGAHLAFDMVLGILLAASPWLLDFNDQVYKPHLYIGIFMFIVALISFKPLGVKKLHFQRETNKIQLN